MAFSLPSGFTPLRDAVAAADGSCFIGIIIDIKKAVPVNNDWALEFTVQDENGQSDLLCRAQRRNSSDLPKSGSPGDVAILRKMKIVTRHRKPLAITSRDLRSEITIFHAKSIPMRELSTGYSRGGLETISFSGMPFSQGPSPEEQIAIINLKAEASRHLPEVQKSSRPAPAAPKPRFGSKKMALVQDMTFGKYYDLVGEVVKTYYPDYTTMDLQFTDYTENKDLFLHLDPDEEDEDFSYMTHKKWAGPFGQFTIAIRLWEPHASWVRNNLKEGDFVFLQNVHAKFSKENKLEGAIHQDQRYPDKICVHRCTRQDQIAALNQRKDAYEKACYQRKQARLAPQNLPKKASAKAAAKKKEEKKERQKLQREMEQRELVKKMEEEEVAKAGINSHIRAGYPEIRLSTVTEIVHNPSRRIKLDGGIYLDLPFINCKYRARLRVVDMYPATLSKFARSLADTAQAANLSTKDAERLKTKFEWSFTLFVEDASTSTINKPSRFPLYIGNEHGQNLLKMDAVDLEQRPERLKQLEEKLFILWGNLHEQKMALLEEGVKLPLASDDAKFGLQNMPFDCCVEEYGVKVREELEDGVPESWKRVFSPFNTTIMD